MHDVLEYVLAASPVAAYAALTDVVREAELEVVQADARHLTLAFRPAGDGWGDDPTVLAAVLDAGHGLCKLVLAGRDGREGGIVGLTDAPRSLFVAVERRLHAGTGRTPMAPGGVQRVSP